MSTARSTVSGSDHRLVSSVQFVVSHEKKAASCINLRNGAAPLFKLVDSMSTSDELAVPFGLSINLHESRGDAADSASSRAIRAEFTLSREESAVEAGRVSLFVYSASIDPNHRDSMVACEALLPPRRGCSCFHQCIWCCELKIKDHTRDDGPEPADKTRAFWSESIVILQHICEECRFQLIDRIRQNMFA